MQYVAEYPYCLPYRAIVPYFSRVENRDFYKIRMSVNYFPQSRAYTNSKISGNISVGHKCTM